MPHLEIQLTQQVVCNQIQYGKHYSLYYIKYSYSEILKLCILYDLSTNLFSILKYYNLN